MDENVMFTQYYESNDQILKKCPKMFAMKWFLVRRSSQNYPFFYFPPNNKLKLVIIHEPLKNAPFLSQGRMAGPIL